MTKYLLTRKQQKLPELPMNQVNRLPTCPFHKPGFENGTSLGSIKIYPLFQDGRNLIYSNSWEKTHTWRHRYHKIAVFIKSIPSKSTNPLSQSPQTSTENHLHQPSPLCPNDIPTKPHLLPHRWHRGGPWNLRLQRRLEAASRGVAGG